MNLVTQSAMLLTETEIILIGMLPVIAMLGIIGNVIQIVIAYQVIPMKWVSRLALMRVGPSFGRVTWVDAVLQTMNVKALSQAELWSISKLPGYTRKFMVDVLKANPSAIHSLDEYKNKLTADVAVLNASLNKRLQQA